MHPNLLAVPLGMVEHCEFNNFWHTFLRCCYQPVDLSVFQCLLTLVHFFSTSTNPFLKKNVKTFRLVKIESSRRCGFPSRLDLFIPKGGPPGQRFPVSLVTQFCPGGNLAEAIALRTSTFHRYKTTVERFETQLYSHVTNPEIWLNYVEFGV